MRGVRIADNPTPTNNWCAPTDCTNQDNTPTDAKPTWGNATSPSIRAQPVPRIASSSPSNACGLTHCGQPHPHPSLAPNSALRTTAAPPTMGGHQRTCRPVDGVSQKLTTPICDLGKRSPDTGRRQLLRDHPQAAGANADLRIADNPAHTHHWPAPTNCTNQRNSPAHPNPTWANAAPLSIRA